MASRACPACGDERCTSAGSKSAYELVRCARCGTVRTSRIPPHESLHVFYDGYYDAVNLKAPDFIDQRLTEIVRGFAGRRQTGRFLDIGFGAGALLRAARSEGWEVSGTDVSESAVAHATAEGFEVVQGHLAGARYPDGTFDVVAAVELLEHVIDPLALVVEIRRVLRPGGLLWATTPHARGLSARLLGRRWSAVAPPEHMQLFSIEGMRELLRRAGFREVRLEAKGTTVHEVLMRFRRREVSAGERVQAGYAWNERLSTRSSGRVVKRSVNAVLSLLRLGDSLKVHATA